MKSLSLRVHARFGSGAGAARAKHGCCLALTMPACLDDSSSLLVMCLQTPIGLTPAEDVRCQVEGMFRSTLADPNGLLVRESSLD